VGKKLAFWSSLKYDERVQGAGFKVQGEGCKAQGAGFTVEDLKVIIFSVRRVPCAVSREPLFQFSAF
jgi:hypothetical protein